MEIRKLWNLLKEAEQAAKDAEIEVCIANFTDKQDSLLKAWYSGTYSKIAAMGGNRSGKTYSAAALFAKHIRDDARPGEYWCVCPKAEISVKGQQKALWELLPKSGFGKFKWNAKSGFGSTNPMFIYDECTAENPDGRNIEVYFKTLAQYDDDMQSFESMSVMDCWIDEAVSEELFAAVETRIILNDGKVLISTIPSQAAEWMYEVIHHAQDDDGVFLVEMFPEDNPIMTEEKLSRFIKAIPSHLREMRLAGKFLMAGARVYVEFDTDRHVLKHTDVPKEVSWYACLDEGMDHPTAWLLVAVDKSGALYVYDEYYSRNQPPTEDVKAISAIQGKKKLVWPTVADPALWQSRKTGMSAIAYQDAGLPVIPGVSTTKFGEDQAVYRIKDLLREERLFVCESCTNLIREFHLWKYKQDRQNKPLQKDAYEDRNNDGLDALRYLLTKVPRYVERKRGSFMSIPFD